MFPAVGLMLLYIVLVSSIHAYASEDRKLYGQIGLAFAIAAAVMLASTHYVQFTVVPASLMNEEIEDIALLT